MSESVNDTGKSRTPEQDSPATIPVNPGDVDVTQKIEIDYREIIGRDGKKATKAVTGESKRKSAGSSSLTGKSVFHRKRVSDDYVKSSSMIYTIGSVPPLKNRFELQDISNNYDLKEELASGSQGIIRNAFDKALKRNVVVKSLKRDEAEELARKEERHFVSEARIMAQLDHPSIIPLYGLHSGTENHLHLAMKHIHGKTLQKYLDDVVLLYKREGVNNFDEQRSTANRIEYLIKVCEAIDYAHCKGVIHRDLKPENIMIGNYGEVYVMDWGLSCLEHPLTKLNDGRSMEITHPKDELVGTPCYIAPEIIRGGSCSPQSDIFSLGMILFEIITLTKAVPGETVNEVLKNIINWNYRPFRHRFMKGQLSPDLKAIIVKAINDKLSKRYKTAGDMAKDLRLYLRREETSARPDNFFRKCIRTMVNHKFITAIATLSVLLCFAAITIHSLYRQNRLIREQKEREEMLTHFQHGTARRANEMERIFFYFKNQLSNVAYNAGLVLSRAADSKAKVYTYEDFRKDSTAPPDYTLSKYYGIKVSLEHAVIKLGPGTEMTDLQNRRIVSMWQIFKHILFTSNLEFENENKLLVRHTILNTGAPLSWIFIGLTNGTMYSYPGKSTYVENYDPRKRPWYKKALTMKSKIIWSEPYQCAVSAKIVIACTKCIFDEKGKFQGVVGMDISLDYIKRHLFGRQAGPGIKEYLLTSAGKIILSSDFEYKKARTDRQKATLIKKEFPFGEEFRRAVKNDQVMFEARRFDTKYIFVLNRIPSLGYYYIEQVSAKKLEKSWTQKLQ